MAKVDPNEPVNRKTLDEAVAAILEGMSNLVEGLRTDMNNKVDGLGIEMTTRFDGLEAKLNQTRTEFKDEIDGLKADLSTTPSRREFEELKAKVEKRPYPLS